MLPVTSSSLIPNLSAICSELAIASAAATEPPSRDSKAILFAVSNSFAEITAWVNFAMTPTDNAAATAAI